ncbi:anti-sigma factor antagonist [Shewanella sp. Choline-02u-19]|uniref:STAS domain-containing protein n=1 Tax=unclassified Shewanella TaxID=196818 RepID=UPI000C326FC4|nr:MULTISPECIES: STAS domain-containing protein [unclassified Shewanella]PKG56753.1 anti-sigma factor antagonist [Shewanella sp. GutDb-MelDb]PKH54084.1 anti-sigma factor antagonist [Shewanella sp. Bg11-22]PKI30451.1 anti-sigma factor antagonist [Shewanella sp. Choline-02u-19]
MQFDIIEKGQYTIIQVNEGRFDAKLAPAFREQIALIKGNIREQLVLDLGQVRFMDSSGLGAVMGAYKMLSNIKISIVNPQKTVIDLLKLTRMDKLILSHPTIEDALASTA